MTPIDLAEDDGASFTIEARGPEAHAAAQDHARAARPERQVDRLFAGPAALSDEARRLRSEGRAQSAEPRQVRLRPHLLGRGDHHRHRRDQAAEIRLRPGLHRGVARLAPHLGQHRLLPLGAVSLLQRHRHDARPPQSRFMGGLVLGRGASLGPHAARRPVGDLRHRRGLPAELRHDRVVGGRPGDHLGLLRRAGRHRAPAVAEGPQARHQGRPRRSVLQRHRAVPAGQVVRAEADHVAGDGDGDRLRLDQGRPLRQGVREDPHRRLRRLEGVSHRRRGRHRRRRRSGRRRKPAFRPRTCARSPASGAGSASISRPAAGATATAAPAATRPASSGRASWCACRRCRGSASPAATWATCNGARRSISISISPAIPKAACPATWRTPRCRSRSTSACRNCRP